MEDVIAVLWSQFEAHDEAVKRTRMFEDLPELASFDSVDGSRWYSMGSAARAAQRARFVLLHAGGKYTGRGGVAQDWPGE